MRMFFFRQTTANTFANVSVLVHFRTKRTRESSFEKTCRSVLGRPRARLHEAPRPKRCWPGADVRISALPLSLTLLCFLIICHIISIYIYTHTHRHTDTQTHRHTHICRITYYIHIYTYTYIHIYIYIYIYILAVSLWVRARRVSGRGHKVRGFSN